MAEERVAASSGCAGRSNGNGNDGDITNRQQTKKHKQMFDVTLLTLWQINKTFEMVFILLLL